MDIKQIATQCLKDEADALLDLIPCVDDDFFRVCRLIHQCKGKLIITGVGKSGHIGAKIAATLASTGTPSFFINPVDALHGDLGMLSSGDLVLAISNSGNTDELLRLVPNLLKRNIPLISMTGNPQSPLAHYAPYHINIIVKKEIDPFNLVPTASTTATLAMGDAIAIVVMKMRDFKELDFANFHPGGNLGRRLLLKVKDVMQTSRLPIVNKSAMIMNILSIMTDGNLGLVVIVENNKILGLFTSGDLRRTIEKHQNNFLNMSIGDVMNRHPITINENESIVEAEDVLKAKNLLFCLVTNNEGDFVGVLNLRMI